jgi:AhpD family alkylhydroperoxidase
MLIEEPNHHFTGETAMYKDWPAIAANLTVAVKELRGGAPDTMKAFSAMAQGATLAISVATRCDACISFHAESARKHGATRDEVMETVGMAIYMGAGPSVMYAAQAVEAYDQFVAKNATV